MTQERLQKIQTLTQIPSPTGNTYAIMDHLTQELDQLGLDYELTPKGGLLITVPGANQDQHRFVTAHVDTLGAMVRAIKPDGRLKIDRIGGYTFASIEGEYCTIHSAQTGQTYTGTILMHQQSVHVYRDAETAERNQENIEVRIDAPTDSAQATRDLGIEVGDFISLDPRTQITDHGFIKSRHLDDKAAVALIFEQLEAIQAGHLDLAHTTHFYISNNEEIGYGGNSNIAPQVVDYVALDMGAMGDDQQTDEYSVSICVKDGSGPYHLGLRQELVALCQAHDIDYRLDIYPYYGSDASAAMRAGADVRHALFGPGIESSHAFERTHADSLEATAQLLRHYLQSKIKMK